MMASLKAELRKVITVRATYLITLFVVALLVLFAFYVDGIKGEATSFNPLKVNELLVGAVPFVSLFGAFIGVLSVTNEYRYNTIMHTLTLARRRTHVLLAKWLVMSVLSVLYTASMLVLAVLLMYAGLAIKGIDLVPQTVYYADLLWRLFFYAWAYWSLALVIAFFIRNQVGAIMTILIAPGTVESLLSLLLKTNAVYLPFTLLGTVLNQNNMVGPTGGPIASVTPGKAALISLCYLIVLWVVAAVVFVRRDAN